MSNATNNFATKMALKFEGPYMVVSFITSVIVSLRDDKKRQKMSKVNHVKPFYQLVPSNLDNSRETDFGERLCVLLLSGLH